MDLLDMLTSMPSSFPHHLGSSAYPSAVHPHQTQQQTPVIAGKKRPLATLAALRRPPLDPIVLAASLSSGPHVTRHHFHHAFGGAADGEGSAQAPARARRARQREQASQAQASTSTSASQVPSSSRSGAYANCDEVPATTSAVSHTHTDSVPEVTEEERMMYASRQAPRSVRLRREQEAKERLAQAKAEQDEKTRDTQSRSEQREESPANAATVRQAHQGHVQDMVGTRASDEAPLPGAPTSQPLPLPSTAPPSLAIAKALEERKAIAASPNLALGSLPSPSLQIVGGQLGQSALPQTPLNRSAISSIVRPPPLSVRCHARTRIPTPHGEVFCHLYRNNYDTKEHLALVIDPEQNDEESMMISKDGKPHRHSKGRPLRSKTLDEVWGPEETDMERIVRGAYVGRLGPSYQVASRPSDLGKIEQAAEEDEGESIAPLVRIHSECYTGETIGSQRCDCGEQLDEAIRLISQSGSEAQEACSSSRHRHHESSGTKPYYPPRGVVVYLRQEGRGIGLLDKLMAYNLQDMGHDTVSANVLLGHLPDARKYDVASAILRDLGVDDCRLLTNNPEKMEALEAEGVHVRERVGMVPRAWRCGGRSSHSKRNKRKATARQSKKSVGKQRKSRVHELATSHGSLDQSILSQADTDSEEDAHGVGHAHRLSEQEENSSDSEAGDSDASHDSYVSHLMRRSGATMLGGSITRGPELEKYLRTKVERMGHLLELPPGEVAQEATKRKAKGEANSHTDSEPGITVSSVAALQIRQTGFTAAAGPTTAAQHAMRPQMSRSGLSSVSLSTDPGSLLDESELRKYDEIEGYHDADDSAAGSGKDAQHSAGHAGSDGDEEIVLVSRANSAGDARAGQ